MTATRSGSAAPWLYGIARNVLLQSVRRGRLEDTALQRLGVLEHVGRAEATPDEDWLDDVDGLLDSLPAVQRRAVELRVLEDLPYSRIAADLAISPENARARVHRALKTLRERHPTTTGDQR